MKKYGIIIAVVVFAVTALAMAPAVWAAEHQAGAAPDKTEGDQAAGRMQQGQSGQMQQEGTAGQMHSRQAGADYNQRFHSTVRGTQLIGREVINRSDEQLGEVEDIVIGRDGRVNYLVVSHGGVLGIGDKLIPVPFSAIDREAGGKERIILNVSREELENAPNFAQNQWPDFSDESYERNVRGYFGDDQTGGQTGMEPQGAGEMGTHEEKPGTMMQEGQPESRTTN